jgi:uncharacterized protein (DUF302 family)
MTLRLFQEVITTVFFLLFAFSTPVFANGQIDIYEKSSEKSLEEILEDAEFAITERNFRIVYRLHIGKAIQDRGKPDFPDFEIIMYCNITFAEKMLELEPRMINACPGRITVRGEGNHYIVAGPLWPEENGNVELNKIMHDMNDLVRRIVDYSAAERPEADREPPAQ